MIAIIMIRLRATAPWLTGAVLLNAVYLTFMGKYKPIIFYSGESKVTIFLVYTFLYFVVALAILIPSYLITDWIERRRK